MDSGEFSSYQLMVQKNIEENRKILRSLGLTIGTPHVTKQKISRPSYVSISRPKNQQSVAPNNFQATRIHTRRSSSVLQSVNFDDSTAFPDTNNDEENTPPQKKIKREPVFGEIEGVQVGDWWPSRFDCSTAGVHRPTVAGIHGKQGEGCYSIALSGGYEDDIDCGNCFTYTGCGGRDLKGTKCNPKNLRTAPQSKDQVLEGLNAALVTNIDNKKPVRVIRGFKLQSPYAPELGYRYDGLYSVEKYWTAKGLSGFKVYKFALKRLADQDPPPWENCVQEIEPVLLKELPSTEGNVSLTQINKMHTTESVSSKNESESFKDCSLNLSPKISSRGRPRKQSFPRQYMETNYNNLDNNESISISSSEIQKELKNDNVVKKSLKLTETIIPNDMNCLNDSTSLKFHTNINVESVKENNLSGNSSGEIAHLCTTSETPVQNKNPSPSKDVKSQSIVCSPNSSRKRVTFSPAVNGTNGQFHEIKSVEEEGNKSTDLTDKDCSDKKTQTLILNYFSPIKNPLEKVSPKSTVAPKSLRSNRLTCSFMNVDNATIQSNVPPNKNNCVLNNESVTPSGENDCSSSLKKLSPKKEVKSSSHKRKYSSSFIKHKQFLDIPMTKNGPSMMENLIKQNNDKLKLHNQIRPTKRKYHEVSPVKQCSVVLNRIRIKESDRTNFIGWDFDSEHFIGFDEINIVKAQETCDKFKLFAKSCDNFQVSSEKQNVELKGFHGWDVDKDEFKGTSGLVPLAFMIDKLDNCTPSYQVD